METKKILHDVAFVLVIIGGINWGLFGLFVTDGVGFDLVQALFGSVPTVAEIIYVLIGISAVYLAVTYKNGFKK